MSEPFRAHIRPAHLGDVEAMIDLLAELFAVEADFGADAATQERGLNLLLKQPDDRARLLVAEADGEVVGMVGVQVLVSTAEGGRVGLLEDLVVRRDWRRRGVGTALLEMAESWARAQGLLRLQLLADADNAVGSIFYGSRRWRQTRLVCLRRAEWTKP